MLLLVALSITLSIGLGNEARKTILRKQEDFATILANSLNNQIYIRFTGPTFFYYKRIALKIPAQYQALDGVVRDVIHDLQVRDLRIYTHDQTVTYSTNKEDLGRTDLASPAVKNATTSDGPVCEVEAKMSYLKAFFSFSLEPGTFMFRTTTPLRVDTRLASSTEDGPVMGVLEFRQDITQDMERAIRFQQIALLVILSGFFLFLGILLYIVRRAERALALRMAAEQRLVHELHQSEKLAGMGRVVAGIAHEIRNPLGIISSSAELLTKRASVKEDPATFRILQAVYDEARRLSRTVNDFLDYARPKSPTKEPVNMAEVVEKAVAFLGHDFAEKGIVIDRSGLPEKMPLVAGDRDLLYRAVYNIMVNAAQAVGNTGSLTVTAGEEMGAPSLLRLTFRDSGPGFPADKIEQLLDPFFTTKDDGTGLGLPIVGSIIAGHGGTLRFANAPEGGAAVTVCLPICK